MIRVPDFSGLDKPVPAVLWVVAVQHLCDTAAQPPRRKSERGRALFCFGCRSSVDPGQVYRGLYSDWKEGIAAHVECVDALLGKAKELDALNGFHFTENILKERLSA